MIFPYIFTCLLICNIVVPVVDATPQIFTDDIDYCTHQYFENKKWKQLHFPNQVWETSVGNSSIYFSMCGQPPQCPNGKACIHSSGKFKVLARDFEKIDGEEVFESRGGEQCAESVYTLKISLHRSNKRNLKMILMDDDCNIELMIPHPEYRPKCTDIIGYVHLLNLQNFSRIIDFTTGSRNFSLNLCGQNDNCAKSGISGCEILNDGRKVSLFDSNSQHLNYDVGKNELTVRGFYRNTGKPLSKVEILIKCNWKTQLLNPMYKEPQKQGLTYKFEVQSDFGCIKLPQKCTVVASIGNLHYNLSLLNNSTGWKVSGVPSGEIILNICGSLNNTKSLCSEQFSQVCHVDGDSVANRGSILKLTAQDGIVAEFISGSTCKENTTLLYSTRIEFQCAEGNGPVFKEYRGCTTILEWSTPYACPINYYKSQNCYWSDVIGRRDMTGLYSANDKVLNVSPDTIIEYNLCGPIHKTCANSTNVSFCLRSVQEERILAGANKDLINDNGLVKMELTGTICPNGNSTAHVTINFLCSYLAPSPPPTVQVVEDKCKYSVTIFTSLVCITPKKYADCSFTKSGIIHNISSLSYYDRNYVIRESDAIEYILNICGPVVSYPGALCKENTMVCRRNKTELNFQKQFVSLGRIAGPTINLNNTVVIESQFGNLCFGQGKSYLYFECSQMPKEPRLLRHDECNYHFLFQVPEVCEKSCILSSSGSSLNLAAYEQKDFEVTVSDTKYRFFLCKDFYISTTKGVNFTASLRRDLTINNNRTLVNFHLGTNCAENSFDKVILIVECGDEAVIMESATVVSCTLFVTMRLRGICEVVTSDKAAPVVETSPTTVAARTTEHIGSVPVPDSVPVPHSVPVLHSVPLIRRSVPTRCTIIDSGYELKLKNFRTMKKIYNLSAYTVNFDGSDRNCPGALCVNGLTVLPSDECPINVFNKSEHSVSLLYYTAQPCESNSFYNVEFRLKCSERNASDIKTAESCKLSFGYDSPLVCPFFEKNEIATSSFSPVSVIIGTIVGGILVILGVVFCILKRKSCGKLGYISIHRQRPSHALILKDL